MVAKDDLDMLVPQLILSNKMKCVFFQLYQTNRVEKEKQLHEEKIYNSVETLENLKNTTSN
jgi:hypothetical protein